MIIKQLVLIGNSEILGRARLLETGGDGWRRGRRAETLGDAGDERGGAVTVCDGPRPPVPLEWGESVRSAGLGRFSRAQTYTVQSGSAWFTRNRAQTVPKPSDHCFGGRFRQRDEMMRRRTRTRHQNQCQPINTLSGGSLYKGRPPPKEVDAADVKDDLGTTRGGC